jgi:hypothetical protein
MTAIRGHFNHLMDVDKHYRRKEELLFSFLEKHGITGPPKVMWGKHDETRALLRGALEAAAVAPGSAAEARAVVALAVKPAVQAIHDMIGREENILLPMSLDTLDELEWWEIARQSAEIGFCLVDPSDTWRPASIPAPLETGEAQGGRIRLPTGSLTVKELEVMLNALPFDATFVDAEDRVRYFTHGSERVFARSRAVLGRKVQHCHPPSSVDTVDRILEGFRSGRRHRADFWIDMRGRFVHIEYVALRDAGGAYLGCLEVTQDLTAKRALTGEQRLLSWSEEVGGAPTGRPAWAVEGAVNRTLDARAAIEAGEHPMPQVMADLAKLGDAQVYELVTPFVPAPLLDLARGKGFASYSVTEAPGLVRSYFRKEG